MAGTRREGWTDERLVAFGEPTRLVAVDAPGPAVAWATQELARLERAWDPWRVGSDLARLNAGADPLVRVSPDLRAALVKAVELWWSTDGWFDPTVLDALESWGAGPAAGSAAANVPTAPDLGVPARGCRSVRVEGTAVTRPPGLRFDLGGVAGGLAADRVAEGLVERGARAAVVTLGAEVRAAGDPPAPWVLPIVHPGDGSLIERVELTEGALAVVSTRRHRWKVRRGPTTVVAHDVVDPAAGAPSRSGVAAVVAVGERAWAAEGVATAALAAGADAGPRQLIRHGLRGWLVGDDGVVDAVVPAGVRSRPGG